MELIIRFAFAGSVFSGVEELRNFICLVVDGWEFLVYRGSRLKEK